MSGITLSLKGQTALVTGGSSGLGPAIVRRLDEAGASVVIHYHANEGGASQVAAALSNPGMTVAADLTDPDAVQSLFERARSHTGRLDILVNCAAAESQDVGEFLSLADDRWARTLAANLDAPRLLTRLFATQDIPGSVINITSIEASRPAGGHSHYATSKAALEMLTKATALELGEKGIRVNAIAPGLIDRAGIAEGWPEGVARWKQTSPLGQLVSPDNIGSAVVFLASSEASSVSGTVLTIDTGVSTHPGW